MAQNPHAHFDQTALEMIEHSPVGAVPHTPTYQDALGRLLAAHQVYVSADHKGGHVTVRSLAGQPSFYAQNLESFLAGTAEANEVESDTSIFNRYVQFLPVALRDKAEAWRLRVVGAKSHHRKHGGEVAQDPVQTLLLVPGCGPHPGLPGNYLYGSIFQTGTDIGSDPWTLQFHDSDDGAATCEAISRSEALTKVQEVLASAPFQLSELTALGFRSN